MAKKAFTKSKAKKLSARRKRVSKTPPKRSRAPAKRTPKRTNRRAPSAMTAAVSSFAPVVGQIVALAAASPIADFDWKNRGVAPIGYMKGMAVTYGRVYCKFLADDVAAVEMAKADTHAPTVDALSLYTPEFQALGWSNETTSADTLRHLFVLLIGLGMRESSGQYCEGRDYSAENTEGETAEAGLFQVSFNARSMSPLLPPLFATYQASPSGFVEIFKEGVTCKPKMLKNWGTGTGTEFQQLTKEAPAFAAEFAAVGLRNKLGHWGPIKRKEAQIIRDCDTMLRGVQDIVDSSAGACEALG
jgi:hypothetical protein